MTEAKSESSGTTFNIIIIVHRGSQQLLLSIVVPGQHELCDFREKKRQQLIMEYSVHVTDVQQMHSL